MSFFFGQPVPEGDVREGLAVPLQSHLRRRSWEDAAAFPSSLLATSNTEEGPTGQNQYPALGGDRQAFSGS